ncbi:unnamed protein product [Peniophora sp. CBMAI 1063]|nr:unnamed protein product [Peniophora sp. CBMAI 1063]
MSATPPDQRYVVYPTPSEESTEEEQDQDGQQDRDEDEAEAEDEDQDQDEDQDEDEDEDEDGNEDKNEDEDEDEDGDGDEDEDEDVGAYLGRHWESSLTRTGRGSTPEDIETTEHEPVSLASHPRVQENLKKYGKEGCPTSIQVHHNVNGDLLSSPRSLQPGDAVLVLPPSWKTEEPWPAIILCDDSNGQILVQWFERPDNLIARLCDYEEITWVAECMKLLNDCKKAKANYNLLVTSEIDSIAKGSVLAAPSISQFKAMYNLYPKSYIDVDVDKRSGRPTFAMKRNHRPHVLGKSTSQPSAERAPKRARLEVASVDENHGRSTKKRGTKKRGRKGGRLLKDPSPEI